MCTRRGLFSALLEIRQEYQLIRLCRLDAEFLNVDVLHTDSITRGDTTPTECHG